MPVDARLLQASRVADAILADLAAALEEAVLRLVARLDTRAGVTVQGAQSAQVVSDVRAQVAELARSRGLATLSEQLAADLPEVVLEALRSDFPELGQFAPQIEADLVRYFSEDVEAGLRDIPEQVAGDVARAIRQSVTVGETVDGLIERVAQSIDTSLGRASVLVERKIRNFAEEGLRRAGEAAAEEVGEPLVYEYVGPTDGKVRPYCQARVGKYLTQAQADALDDSQRYNCRHSLAPILLEDARAEGMEAFRD